tara:strand:+ start:328 stop:534 length:207 start_codon:yes stop_codon:yes gene_type:complete
MKIKVNGDETIVESKKSNTLKETMKILGYSSSKVVVELNKKIINSEEWKNNYIKDGDKLEIVSIVGGG